MAQHIVQPGECLAKIAYRYGFWWKKIWEHPDNAALRQKRKTPNVLQAGDVVHLPDKERKTIEGATGRRHVIRRRGTPAIVRLRVLEGNVPKKKRDFLLEFDDGTECRDQTDEQGTVVACVSPEVASGILTLFDGDIREVFRIQLGALDPLDEIHGVQQRLRNLGYDCPLSGEIDDPTGQALRLFQSDSEGLDPSGALDAETKKRLWELHGS